MKLLNSLNSLLLPKPEIERLEREVGTNRGARGAQHYSMGSYKLCPGDKAARNAIVLLRRPLSGRGEVALDAVDADTFEASVDGLKVTDGQGGKVFGWHPEAV